MLTNSFFLYISGMRNKEQLKHLHKSRKEARKLKAVKKSNSNFILNQIFEDQYRGLNKPFRLESQQEIIDRLFNYKRG